jgi:hypothetical protein
MGSSGVAVTEGSSPPEVVADVAVGVADGEPVEVGVEVAVPSLSVGTGSPSPGNPTQNASRIRPRMLIPTVIAH